MSAVHCPRQRRQDKDGTLHNSSCYDGLVSYLEPSASLAKFSQGPKSSVLFISPKYR